MSSTPTILLFILLSFKIAGIFSPREWLLTKFQFYIAIRSQDIEYLVIFSTYTFIQFTISKKKKLTKICLILQELHPEDMINILPSKNNIIIICYHHKGWEIKVEDNLFTHGWRKMLKYHNIKLGYITIITH